MIGNKNEVSSIKELVEFLYSIYYSKGFFLYLTVLTLCGGKCLGCIGNQAFCSITVAVKEDCSNANI